MLQSFYHGILPASISNGIDKDVSPEAWSVSLSSTKSLKKEKIGGEGEKAVGQCREIVNIETWRAKRARVLNKWAF